MLPTHSKVNFIDLNLSDENEIEKAAWIHESAPLNWDPQFKFSENRVVMTRTFIKESIHSKNEKYIIAKVNEEIVGFHWLSTKKDDHGPIAHIKSLWVHENFRKMGIGQKLKELGEEWALQQGMPYISTEVFYINQNMIKFNQKLGFKPMQVTMIKSLSNNII